MMQSPLANIPPVIKNLLIINIIFFIATYTLPGLELTARLSAFYPLAPLFKAWQPITYMFMHGSLGHIFFNMLALVMFGSTIERVLGLKRFVEFYFITGLGALALHMAVQAIELHAAIGSFSIANVDPTAMLSQDAVQTATDIYRTPILGASGAVFGVLLAFAYLFPNTELLILFIPVPVKAKYVVAGYMAIELFSGFGRFQNDSVAHFAHIGGALFGFILLKIWGYRSSNNMY
ncbi:rhomboid family intramembrane serine protease [Mucilaginibacter gynuensis]|uniref:Rhomboid family intramembrane serine protease n=1 Tax=Mucilaginibacter gynuensis TaxID=1302236 RepID=A0ABP8GAY3_9SPHI